MRLRIASLTILSLALAAVPAWANYDNGAINGTIDAWAINYGYVVSDSFVADNSFVTGFQFGAWEFPGDVLSSVQWSITSAQNGGTLYGSGIASGKNLTDKYLSNNQYYEIIDEITVSGLNVAVTSGSTYWLTLQNAVVPSGDPVYWDENSGVGCGSPGCPSKAKLYSPLLGGSETAVGTIASEAFTVITSGQGTPEPNSFLLFGSGILGIAGVLRRRFWKSY